MEFFANFFHYEPHCNYFLKMMIYNLHIYICQILFWSLNNYLYSEWTNNQYVNNIIDVLIVNKIKLNQGFFDKNYTIFIFCHRVKYFNI